jgi:hypothetical protein
VGKPSYAAELQPPTRLASQRSTSPSRSHIPTTSAGFSSSLGLSAIDPASYVRASGAGPRDLVSVRRLASQRSTFRRNCRAGGQRWCLRFSSSLGLSAIDSRSCNRLPARKRMLVPRPKKLPVPAPLRSSAESSSATRCAASGTVVPPPRSAAGRYRDDDRCRPYSPHACPLVSVGGIQVRSRVR